MAKVVITPRGFAKCGLDNVALFEAAGIDLVYNDTGLSYTKEQFYDVTADADGVVVGVELVDRAYIDAHPNLKAVVKFGVGTDNIDLDYCKEKNIFVGRTVGSNARSVAETAISFVIADSKNLWESFKSTHDGGWAKLTGYEIGGKTIGIIGFGAIGREVAKMAYGLGMKVLAFDVCPIADEFIKAWDVTVATVDEILTNADFVSLHIPLMPSTKDFIGKKQLEMMKRSAVLINTARGGIVNEQELYDALKAKEIKAAYFDVFSSEPPAKDEPLMTLDNFYLTPHIASRSAEAEKNTADMSSKIIIEALKG